MRISRKAFDKLVEAAIDSLPEQFVPWLEQVPIIVEDRPSARDRGAAGSDPLGLYVGHPIHELRESGELPARIMIYREQLMEACSTHEQLAAEIRKTVIHELGHHAGMDEEELEKRGFGNMEGDSIDWDLSSPEEEAGEP
jgi:predicted Zn-dependent protease with MMP-like domain